MQAWGFVAVVALAACGGPGLAPISYRADSAWLCLPGRADPCAREIQMIDELPNGSHGAAQTVQTTPAGIDCFYVYPTVDDSAHVGNHTDFTDRSAIANVTAMQAVPFRRVCDLYVPLYRQITMGTYAQDDAFTDEGLANAYADVRAAFDEYAAKHPDRGIVLIGHSQGAEMVTRLLRERFDNDRALRARLVVALVLGGNLAVEVGKRTGGSFANLPTCATAGETGCVIGYRSMHAGGFIAQPDPGYAPGHEEVCVNPGNLTNPDAVAALSPIYLEGTTYTTYFGLYRARCVGTPDHAKMLAVEEVPSARKSPVDLHAPRYSTTFGTHALDVELAEATMIEVVRRAGATWLGKTSLK
ncbi:MAG TPA: DUF3089 domain-containing protein [Kofleriaceae bacterium]